MGGVGPWAQGKGLPSLAGGGGEGGEPFHQKDRRRKQQIPAGSWGLQRECDVVCVRGRVVISQRQSCARVLMAESGGGVKEHGAAFEKRTRWSRLMILESSSGSDHRRGEFKQGRGVNGGEDLGRPGSGGAWHHVR